MLEWLQRLGIDTAGFDRGEFYFRGLEDHAAWVLLILAAAAGLVFVRSSVRELPSRGQRRFLLVWQLLTLALLAALMLQPAIRLAKVARVKERAVVLIDASASMTLPSGAETRAQETAAFLSRRADFFQKLEGEFAVSYFGFDTALHDLSRRPDAPLSTKGESTDLMAALSSVGSVEGGLPLAGVIMISDGADRARLGDRFRATGSDPELKSLLGNFPAPVNTVALGQGASVKDLAIVSARHDDYGFVHNPFEVAVKVHAEGELTNQVSVIFRQGERVLASKTIPLLPGQKEAEATLSFTPRQVGEFMFSVAIPPVAGELTAANNVVRFPLKVLRDKVRILYIVGNPSWDERFLRQTLKKDPAVDLISFYILREHWDNYAATENEVSLIPFPSEDLFMQELDSFDLLIWQNFRGELYMFGNYPRFMGMLNHYIRERGGALLMIGGARAFLGQGLMDSNLRDLLPVVPDDRLPNYTEGDFKIELTPAGRRHPIMAVGEGAEDLSSVWGALPPLSGFNRVQQAVPGALVLATHPTETGADGQRLPLIAVQEVGAGRVMAVMTDYSWAWNFVAVGLGLSNKPYQRFWENSLRWLLQDPEMRLLSLTADKGRVALAEPVTLLLEVLDESYNPTDQAEVKVEVLEQPAGSDLKVPAPEKYGIGKYRLTVTPALAGGYSLRATAALQGRSLGHDDAIFAAAEQSAELSEVEPHPEILAAISAATGGKSIPASGDPATFSFRRLGLEQVTGTRELPLWDNWPAFALAFFMLVTLWYLRRKWGLR